MLILGALSNRLKICVAWTQQKPISRSHNNLKICTPCAYYLVSDYDCYSVTYFRSTNTCFLSALLKTEFVIFLNRVILQE